MSVSASPSPPSRAAPNRTRHSLAAPPPADCPGTGAPGAGAAPACAGCPNAAACAAAPPRPPPGALDPDQAAVAARLARVRHVVLVLSGKGGVGKSTLAAQLALALAAAGREVGLLDVDICGPSAPKMLGLEGQEVRQSGSGWSPVYAAENLAVMSIGFMLPRADDAVVWRGEFSRSLELPVEAENVLETNQPTHRPTNQLRNQPTNQPLTNYRPRPKIKFQARARTRSSRSSCATSTGGNWTIWSSTRRRGPPTSTSRSRSF
jgi:hypothetical protein